MRVRADRFLIARAKVTCSGCAASTNVMAIVLPPGHETDESDEMDESDDVAYISNVGGWVGAQQYAFLFFVEQVSQKALEQLWRQGRHYRLPDIYDESGSGLRNHCAHCGAVFDEQGLFCEPGGAFSPANETDAASISLERMDESIEATVAGYAYEPEFFKAMIRV